MELWTVDNQIAVGKAGRDVKRETMISRDRRKSCFEYFGAAVSTKGPDVIREGKELRWSRVGYYFWPASRYISGTAFGTLEAGRESGRRSALDAAYARHWLLIQRREFGGSYTAAGARASTEIAGCRLRDGGRATVFNRIQPKALTGCLKLHIPVDNDMDAQLHVTHTPRSDTPSPRPMPS